MKTKAVRLHGKNDLRLEEFELPQIKEDEMLAHVISDSICMSSYKATKLGNEHKRVPDNVAQQPIIIGHEFSGEILEVGKKWQDKFKVGSKFSIQPALSYEQGPVGPLSAPGYSYQYIGGNATHIIIPKEVMEQNCLLTYTGPGFFPASLSEPQSCIVGAFHANYHVELGTYSHDMGIKEGGKMAILAGVGPMGLGAIDYTFHGNRRPSLLVVTDIDEARLKRAETLFPVSKARKKGIELIYLNTKKFEKPEESLLELTNGNGFDDVFVMAPVKPVVEQGDKLLARDGCLNFFAGPTDTDFFVNINFFNIHYSSTHIVGTSGGNTDDMIESLDMMSKELLNPAIMITHVGGLNSVIETVLHLPDIPGGKKLIYNNINVPLTAIDDFEKLGKDNPLFAQLARIVAKNQGIWSLEAEDYLLANVEKI